MLSMKKQILKSGAVLLLLPTIALASAAQSASAQSATEETINQMFLSDVPLSGANAQEQQNRITIKTVLTDWLGQYQNVQEDGDHYLIQFEQGSIPVAMEFKENGDPMSFNIVGCPVTAVPVSQAASEYREALLTNCPDLTP